MYVINSGHVTARTHMLNEFTLSVDERPVEYAVNNKSVTQAPTVLTQEKSILDCSLSSHPMFLAVFSYVSVT